MRVIISSAGRRVYLVQWFKQALLEAGIQGEIIVAENDVNAASIAASDRFWMLPKYTDSSYHSEFIRMIKILSPDLLLSLNDHELNILADGMARDIRHLGVCVPVLNSLKQRMVNDKYEMSLQLASLGVETPQTALISNFESASKIISDSQEIVVKDRFGSGSSGLKFLTKTQARDWLNSLHRGGHKANELDSLVVQPRLEGQEYGVDVVTPLNGGSPSGVFARKKLAMRNGETSAAISVAPNEFMDVADRVSKILGSKGTIDIDVIVEGHKISVIDINPRFGGGYPFVHLAGVDTPSYFVRSVANLPLKDSWNKYVIGYRASKHEGIIGYTG